MTTTVHHTKKSYRFKVIAERIQQSIIRGDFSCGDRLPAERKMAADLRVSRPSVREALRVLEQKGLVEIRRGRNGGAFVKAPSTEGLPEGMEILLRFGQLSLGQIAEFRGAIEGGIAALAANVAGPEDIRMLNHRLAVARSFVGSGSGGVDAFIEADKALHLCTAQIAGNPLFTHALEAVLGQKQYFCRFLKLNPSFMEENFKDLSGIVQAMEKHQPATASGIIREHISRYNDAIG